MEFTNVDLWANENPQTNYETSQSRASAINSDSLVKLSSGKVMFKNEYKILEQMLSQRPKSNIAVIPKQNIIQQQSIPTQTNNLEIQLNQKGILLLSGIFGLVFITTLALIKIWGTTDVAQQQQFLELSERQNQELAKRYDRLAKVTEKIGKKSDINVCLFSCGSKSDDDESSDTPDLAGFTQSNQLKSSQISSETDYYEAITEVRRWKRNGTSKTEAKSYINWIRKNPSEYPISHASMTKAFNEVY